MNRRYNVDEYYKGVELLREYFPDAAVTTDVIVGFPGETEEEFNITKKYLEKVCFYEMHVFKYSREKVPLQIKCLTRFLKILNQKEVQNFLNLMKY